MSFTLELYFNIPDFPLQCHSEDINKQLQDELNFVKDSLLSSTQSKQDLSEIYSQHIKNSETDAMDYIRSLSERLLLEREEAIAKMSAAFEHDREVRQTFHHEINRELTRLREELFKSRRAEAQREREMAFLQSQLIDAVERIASLDKRSRELEEAKRLFDESQVFYDSYPIMNVDAASADRKIDNKVDNTIHAAASVTISSVENISDSKGQSSSNANNLSGKSLLSGFIPTISVTATSISPRSTIKKTSSK